jgi:uncharacterized protein YqgV (UPF0045/DUF77 family)
MKAETPPGRGNPLNLNGIMPAEEKDMTKPKASVSFQVLPKTNSDQETIRIVDKVIHMIKKSGINYEVGPMETTMEGDLKTLLQIVEKAQRLCIKAGAKSVFTNVKINYSQKGILTIDQKIKKYR